jgi:hypothetical protein
VAIHTKNSFINNCQSIRLPNDAWIASKHRDWGLLTVDIKKDLPVSTMPPPKHKSGHEEKEADATG